MDCDLGTIYIYIYICVCVCVWDYISYKEDNPVMKDDDCLYIIWRYNQFSSISSIKNKQPLSRHQVFNAICDLALANITP